MKQKLIALMIASLFSVSALATDKTTTTDPAKQKDEQILGILIVLNKNEIAAANAISNKKVIHDVKQYADMMHKEHGQNLKETMKLSNKIGKPIKDDDAKNLEKSGKDELASLKKLKDKELQKTYIDNMVKDHESALQTIDNDLLKNVSNADLKKHLEATREHVSHHLDKAKEIQSTLASS